VAAGVSSAGIVGGVVSGGVSVWTQADAVKNHQVAAGQATANVVVDTGVGVAAGMSGAAVGAAVGSVVPVAGTAVGAVVGFAVGMGVGWVAQHSGAVDAAKQALGRTLTDHFEKPLQKAWDGAAKGVDAVKSAGGTVSHAASSAWHAATSWL
jgi:phage tail tape-measure protein